MDETSENKTVDNSTKQSGLKKWWGSWFDNPNQPSPPPIVDKVVEVRKDFVKLLEELATIGKISDEISVINVKNNYLSFIEKVGSAFEAYGTEDGKLEINPKLAVDFIKSKAKDLQSNIKGVFKSKESVAETTKNAKEEIYNNAKLDLERQKEYVNSIEKKYRWDYKDFAVIIGFLYIFVFLGFAIADYPLSRLIIKDGFEIDSYWESVILSIGITLIGVYFKIWWDEFMISPAEKTVTKNEPENLEGVGKIPSDYQETKIKIIKRVRSLRFVVKTFILMVSLATIWILGYFRFRVYLYTKFILEDKTVPPEISSIWAMLGFVLIAVVFPFLGGISLSLGTDKIQNWRERRSSQKILEKLEDKYLKALEDKEVAEKELAVCQDYLKWCDSEFVKFCEDVFMSRYNHGYEIGVTKNNLGLDTFSKAKDLRKRLLGRNTFSITQTIVPKDIFDN